MDEQRDAAEPEKAPTREASTVKPSAPANNRASGNQETSWPNLTPLVSAFLAPPALAFLVYLLGLFILARKYEVLCRCGPYSAWYLTTLTSRTIAIMHAYRNLLLPSVLSFAQTGLVAGGVLLVLRQLPTGLSALQGRQRRDGIATWRLGIGVGLLTFLVAVGLLTFATATSMEYGKSAYTRIPPVYSLFLAGVALGFGWFLIVRDVVLRSLSPNMLVVTLLVAYLPTLLAAYWDAAYFSSDFPLPTVTLVVRGRHPMITGTLLDHSNGYWYVLLPGRPGRPSVKVDEVPDTDVRSATTSIP